MIDLFRTPGLALTLEGVVEARFLDAMAHMNVAWYAQLFDRAVWKRFAELGLDAAYFEREGRGMFALERNTRYHSELREGQRLAIRTALVEVREKTLGFVHYMLDLDKQVLAATEEVVAAHIDLRTRRTTPFPAELRARFEAALVTALPGSMTDATAQAFARQWIAAWNRRDAEAVLAHYAEDATFMSPRAERITGNHLVEGKAALRAYWLAALSKNRSIEFSLDAALWCPHKETLVVSYLAGFNGEPPNRAAELMRFRGGSIVRGEALYGGLASRAPAA